MNYKKRYNPLKDNLNQRQGQSSGTLTNFKKLQLYVNVKLIRISQ